MADLLRTSNPALGNNAFGDRSIAYGEAMTVTGTVNKTGVLLVCAIATAAWTWNLGQQSPEKAMPLAALGGIGGFIVALVTIFKKSWAPVTAPLYALLEGLVLGAISALFDKTYNHIAVQAVGLTFATLF